MSETEPERPIPHWRSVASFFLDVALALTVTGYAVGLAIGGIETGGPVLEEAVGLAAIILAVLYFYFFDKYLGGTVGRYIFRVAIPNSHENAPYARSVVAFLVDFIASFVVLGYAIALASGQMDQFRFHLTGNRALMLLAAMGAYFVVFDLFLGGTIGRRILKVAPARRGTSHRRRLNESPR